MPARPFNELKCPVCKNTFICYYVNTWAYKTQSRDKRKVFCSWGCKNKYMEEKAKQPTKRGRKKKEA